MLYRLSLYAGTEQWLLLVEPWPDRGPEPAAASAANPAASEANPAASAANPADGVMNSAASAANPTAGTAATGAAGLPSLILPVESFVPVAAFFDEVQDYCLRIIPAVARRTNADTCAGSSADACASGLFAAVARHSEAGASGPLMELRWPLAACGIQQLFRHLGGLASAERMGRTAALYTDLVFRTPLYRLNALAKGLGATVLVKLESMEPGSVKDRAVTGMIRAAMARGELTAGTAVVEASSGNVAFAMAAILQAEFGRKPLIFISCMHGPVKAKAVRCAGCPVILTPAAAGSHGAKLASVDHARTSGAWQLNQHGNPDNPETHRYTTGPELYHQCHQLTGQAPAEFVSGMGSGGTAIGVAMFRDDIAADFKVFGVEPVEASLLTGGTFQAHGFSGIAPGFITPIVERGRQRLDGIETVSRAEGYAICRRMLVEEGLLVGPSSGASIAVALRRAALPENRGKVIVTIAHDRGDRYLDIPGLFEPPPEAFEQELPEASE